MLSLLHVAGVTHCPFPSPHTLIQDPHFTFSKHSPADSRFPIQRPHLDRNIFTDGAFNSQAGCVLGEAKCKRAHVPCIGVTPDHLGSGQPHLQQTVSDSHTVSPREGRM